MIAPLFGRSSSTRSSVVAVRGTASVAKATNGAVAPASAAKRSSARSAGTLLGSFGRMVLLTAVLVFIAVVPLVALLQGADPVSCLLWVLIYGGITLAYALWPGRRPVPTKPPVVNYPVSEAYQAEWGTAERHQRGAPVGETEPRATRYGPRGGKR